MTKKSYGDPDIHRPEKYGEGQVAARHAAALARARAERPDRRPDKPLTGPELAAHGMDLLARRQEARDAGTLGPQADPTDLDRRLLNQQRRRNYASALASLADRFEDYVGAQLGDEPAVLEWAVDAAASRTADWLVLVGPTGVGKTWQATAAYRAVCHDRGLDGLAITVGDLLINSLPSAPDRISLRTYERIPVLLLDDLVGGLSEWKSDVLFELINARDAGNRLTIITSNLRPEEVRPILGDRLASRLSHRMRLVALEGEDRRLSPHS
jgi:DNA replication protein DnaC